MKIETDPICPLCKRDDEDRDDFVLKCEALTSSRDEVLGMPILQPENLANVSLPFQVRFEKEEVPNE
jgi:hypothetical protein